MKTRAAILTGLNEPFKVEELDLQEPQAGEVQVKMAAAGLCHTDVHLQVGDIPVESFPYLGGHEGSGVVEAVGPGVTRVKPGDHVVFSFIPACGHCRWCASGQQNLCDNGASILAGTQLDGTFRLRTSDGTPVPQFCVLGTFSEHAVVPEVSCVKIDDDIPLEPACLVGCGVTTGFGSAVYVAEVAPGDTVVVYGLGGIGTAAVQGAKVSGAKNVVAIDPLENKAEMIRKFGATHAATSHEQAMELVNDMTRGVMADHAIICVGVVPPEVVGQATQIIRKGGQVTLTGTVPPQNASLPVSGFEMLLFQKRVVGNLYGMANPNRDIPKILGLYQSGQILLDEMITSKYPLDDINEGYEDMLKGNNIRGIITFD